MKKVLLFSSSLLLLASFSDAMKLPINTIEYNREKLENTRFRLENTKFKVELAVCETLLINENIKTPDFLIQITKDIIQSLDNKIQLKYRSQINHKLSQVKQPLDKIKIKIFFFNNHLIRIIDNINHILNNLDSTISNIDQIEDNINKAINFKNYVEDQIDQMNTEIEHMNIILNQQYTKILKKTVSTNQKINVLYK